MDCLLKYLLIVILAVTLTPTVLLLALFTIPLLAAEAISAAASHQSRELDAHGLSAVLNRIG